MAGIRGCLVLVGHSFPPFAYRSFGWIPAEIRVRGSNGTHIRLTIRTAFDNSADANAIS
jgi:hypothetical protein